MSLKDKVIKIFKYDYCDSCLNQELDPMQCHDCDEGSNYEDSDEDNVENLTYHDFIEQIRESA